MISRRAFFTGMLCLVGHGWLAGRTVAKADGLSHRSENLAQRISTLFRHPESAVEMGNAYLEINPSEAHLDYVLGLLSKEGLHTSGDRSTPDLRLQISEARQRDFDRGEITWVRGFALSRTEARLCAIVALYTGP